MNNNKQSSVEWLICELINQEYKNPHDTELINIIEQAKAMHKDEICKAYVFGAAYGIDISNGLKPDKYYNETFGGNK